MSKIATRCVCQTCGHVERKSVGQCPKCGGTALADQRAAIVNPKIRLAPPPPRAVRITDVDLSESPRRQLGVQHREALRRLGELDRVLGGGLVPGSVVLVVGEPGVGKSTLLLEVARRLSSSGARTLYVSAEESPQQTRLRAERLNALHDDLYLLAESDLAAITSEIDRVQPAALIIDSVQSVFVPELGGAPGTPSQVREVANRCMQLAKQRGITTFVVGHVAKDGGLAGPKTLEHMVDCVLSFEASRRGPHRILRATKNRFGSTSELAVFEMSTAGLLPVDNPSALFLAERPRGQPGSAVCATVEGTRAMLVEVQALCVQTFGNPRRTSTGIDLNRVALLSAVLERRGGLSLMGMDLFVNVAAGASLDEPAADLPVAMAMASSLRGKAIDPDLVCFGEIGLAGEVRGVPSVESRLEEAARLGFSRAMIPSTGTTTTSARGMTLTRVKSLDEAIALGFG
ncbi:MAG: DNA repair protein RadA [Deltaproteobacteria bacterium]|nr:DNA repair protein RadA [Deltaproteobacteria bacterium]